MPRRIVGLFVCGDELSEPGFEWILEIKWKLVTLSPVIKGICNLSKDPLQIFSPKIF